MVDVRRSSQRCFKAAGFGVQLGPSFTGAPSLHGYSISKSSPHVLQRKLFGASAGGRRESHPMHLKTCEFVISAPGAMGASSLPYPSATVLLAEVTLPPFVRRHTPTLVPCIAGPGR